MEEAQLRRRSADRSETAELNRAVDRGGGDCRGIPSAHAVAARRLPLCAAADDPAPDPIITASLSETAWHLAPARLRTRAPRNENSKPTRSAISISTSLRFEQQRASSTCSSRSTEPRNSPSS